VSQIFIRDRAHPGTQPRRHIDNSQLYENIGNIVIERAHAGDDHCLEIYKRAWQLSSKEQIKSVTGLDGKSEPVAADKCSTGDVYNGIRRTSK
jgi:hypothetical protein